MRRELDLSGFAYEPIESLNARISDETEGGAAEIQQPSVASSSAVRQMFFFWIQAPIGL